MTFQNFPKQEAGHQDLVYLVIVTKQNLFQKVYYHTSGHLLARYAITMKLHAGVILISVEVQFNKQCNNCTIGKYY